MWKNVPVIITGMLVAGCGMQYAGEYTASPQLMEGREESDRPGYDLEGVQQKLDEEPIRLALHADGSYERHYGEKVNTGEWRVEDGIIYLNQLTRNGQDQRNSVAEDWEYEIRDSDTLVWLHPYSHYGIELVFKKQ